MCFLGVGYLLIFHNFLFIMLTGLMYGFVILIYYYANRLKSLMFYVITYLSS
jgi:hypothetical protein